jgi:hypothetical protein
MVLYYKVSCTLINFKSLQKRISWTTPFLIFQYRSYWRWNAITCCSVHWPLGWPSSRQNIPPCIQMPVRFSGPQLPSCPQCTGVISAYIGLLLGTNPWNKLSPQSTVLLKKLKVAQLINLPRFMEPESSLPCSQEPATGHYPAPDESSPHTHTVYLKDPSPYYLPIYPYNPRVIFITFRYSK